MDTVRHENLSRSSRPLNDHHFFLHPAYPLNSMPSLEPPDQACTTTNSPGLLKPFSISLSNKAKPASALVKPPNSKKRPHSSLADDDSDGGDDAQQPQLVSAFDHSAGGAINVNGPDQKKEPLIIPGRKNRDWRAESFRKKGKNILPPEVQAAQAGLASQVGSTTETNEVSQEAGLSFVKRETNASDRYVEMMKAHTKVNEAQQAESISTIEPTQRKDADQEALEALTSEGLSTSTLVLQASSKNGERGGWMERVSEDDAFRSDVASRPDPAGLDEYAAVPVDEFGAALLRGMGWKEGDVVGKRKNQIIKPRDIARRPALLGIGAKEVPGGVEVLGAWGKAAKGKRKVDKTYNPVLLKNTVTGEMLTEEELEAKQMGQKREEQDWQQRRDRNLARDEEKKSQRRLEDSHESRHRDNPRRERSRSAGKSRHDSSSRDIERSIEKSRISSSRMSGSESEVSSRHSSSRRDRGRSSERKQSRRKDYDADDYERKDKDRRRQQDKHDRYDDSDDGKDRDRRRRQEGNGREEYRSSKILHRR